MSPVVSLTDPTDMQCGIEYNPLNNRNTYATARILYGDRASADRALLHEVSRYMSDEGNVS